MVDAVPRTDLLASCANWVVVFVEDNADFVHKTDLLLIVTRERIGAGVNIREETKHRFSRDRLGSSGGCSRHCDLTWSVREPSLRKDSYVVLAKFKMRQRARYSDGYIRNKIERSKESMDR
jgi:hypothetical protein